MGKFIMLVGLPGSGKSYISAILSEEISENDATSKFEEKYCGDCYYSQCDGFLLSKDDDKLIFCRPAERFQNILNHIETNSVVIRSDEIRQELFGDESIQGNPGDVFSLMRKRTVDALKLGKTVFYDATNVCRKHRVGLLQQLPKGTEKICYIIWSNVESCFEKDNSRSRTVGRDVIMKILKNFQCPRKDEGWDKIEIIRNSLQYYYKDFKLGEINHDNPHHEGTILDHINRVKDEVLKSNHPKKELLYLLACYHDIGKSYCKEFKNAKREPTDIAHYYGHQNVSAYLVLGLNEATISGNELELSWYVNQHMEPFFNSKYFLKEISEDDRQLLLDFNEFDKKGR